MGKRYLVDSNAIIDYSENRFHRSAKLFITAIIDEIPYFSIINKIELLGFSIVKSEIIELIDSSVVYNLTEEIVAYTV